MHIFNNNKVRVFKMFKHFRRILRCNSCQFKVLVLFSLFTWMWLDSSTSKEKDSSSARASSRTQPPKKKLKFKIIWNFQSWKHD
jgi:hypothetical protein